MKLARTNAITLQKTNVKDSEQLLLDGNWLSGLQDTDLLPVREFEYGGLLLCRLLLGGRRHKPVLVYRLTKIVSFSPDEWLL